MEENTTQQQAMCDSDQKGNDLEKTINLNEFLDFLKLSCHVNDMISQNSDLQQQQQPTLIARTLEQTQLSKLSVDQHKPQDASTLDFKQLTENSLLNKFYSGNERNARTTTAEDCKHNIAKNGKAFPSCSCSWNITRQRNCYCGASSSTTSSMTANAASSKNEMKLRSNLNHKLDEILNEGVLDSVLPFICPVPLPTNYTNRLKPKKHHQPEKAAETPEKLAPSSAVEDGPSTSTSATSIDAAPAEEKGPPSRSRQALTKESAKHCNKQTQIRRKSVCRSTPADRKANEIVIHVCDEVKNMSKDFTCPQELLVSKMGYFADVSSGQQLDDMDISVHCDIQIFEWLMKWVKFSAEAKNVADNPPELGCNNVVPILVSASFLKMEPLFLECLSFCHAHLSEVVRISPNLSCLNEPIISRLAAMFTNVELEMVEDKKERLTPRLWAKLIQSLCEVEPEALRGHFSTLAGLFKCSRCNKYLTNTMKTYIMCVPSNMRLNRWGQLVSHHIRDPSWDLNAYITQLFKETKSWRLVYWKLWGHAHYLYCCLCEAHFPVYQISWCPFHTDSATFLGPISEGRMTGPAGRYTCCGQPVYRYDTLPTPNGCHFRDHSVMVETDRERSILSICQLAMDNVALGESPLWKMQEAAVKGECEPRWLGMPLIPQRERHGLLPSISSEEMICRLAQRSKLHNDQGFFDSNTETESSMDSVEDFQVKKKTSRSNSVHSSFSTTSTGSSDGGECTSSLKKKPRKLWSYHKKQIKKKKNPENSGRYWAGDVSARSNQDNQREYEERIMKHMMCLVQKKSATDVRAHVQPLGGSFVRLEQEWREQVKHRTPVLVNSNSSFSLGICGSNSSGSNTSLNIRAAKCKSVSHTICNHLGNGVGGGAGNNNIN